MSTPPSLESRLARVEQVIASLSREVAAIRSELTGASSEPSARTAESLRAAAGEPFHTAPIGTSRPVSRPAASPRQRDPNSLDFERLVGRYGMLGISVFGIIAAVGTFLGWAISHGYLHLGPEARVLLGLAAAIGIGAWGLWLRRTEQSFGSSLLGLALVIVLVCGYAAGPSFHLIPTWVAFAGSAAIAWSLAIFARGQNDEPLWCVAFGGAAIAPFVTSNGSGNLYALLGYALVLLLSACFAISHRLWPVAWRVFYLSAALFVAASTVLAVSHDTNGFFAVCALPLIVGGAGIVPFAPDGRKRAALRWLALLALLATISAEAVNQTTTIVWLGMAEIVAAVALWLLIIDRLRGVTQSSLLASNAGRSTLLDWIDGAAIPLALIFRAGFMGPSIESTSIVYLGAFIVFAVIAWRHPVGSTRDATAFALSTVAVATVFVLPLEMPLARVAVLLALALGALGAHHQRPSLSWVAAVAGLLTSAGVITIAALVHRPMYSAPPFSTEPSLAALSMTGALVIIARFWRWLFDATCEAMGEQPRRQYADSVRMLLRATTGVPWTWAFFWVLIELSMAYSASTSTLLLVTYFAATAVLSVAAGRVRGSARLRQLGLFLAVVAAATAVYGATTYFDVGARILAYLVTSAFLLGIAFWYRRPVTATAVA
jgi:hypothetical protein